MARIQTLAGEWFEPELPNRLLKIAGDIRAAGGRAFLVGGWVRDALLGKACRDYDIEVYDMAQDALVPILSKYGRTNLVGKAFGVIHLAMKGLSLDFSFPRTESKVGYGHRGFVVHTDEKLSFREAALRRDFTINAMGMELPELTLCDPYDGIGDLKTHTLRHVGPAFAEDSLRILRGVQFASRFECTLAPETVELCRTLSLDDLSVERLFEEFKKWLLKPGRPSLGLRAFLDIRLDEYFPEIRPFEGSWEALGGILDKMAELRDSNEGGSAPLTDAQKMEFAFAALLAGSAGTSLKFLERITNEVHLLKVVPPLLETFRTLDPAIVHEAPALRRLAVKLGGLKLLCLLVKCAPHGFFACESTGGTDFATTQNSNFATAQNSDFAAALWDSAAKYGLLESAPQPYLTGKMLLDLGLKPGKQLGEIIKASFELQLDGKITSAEEAVAWARGII
ncbi:tRNA nucleotidyltransferase (CCA-adding enzyme) [Fibrobacter sp. UWT3]|uniref:CCA tRNA nucleotidyltransferase n=1 Tax=Fibrobacter sp. UWT3 TaxID=1896225 RepID=UPI000BDC8034|nr:CCA tRNA nucleotidyltransferase [Fibrobacter sp. UWT3]SOE75448.1 tRNA nucleotidyltransferase (CCA-adding enzyme) [Fibrobacter sp. UWT3]